MKLCWIATWSFEWNLCAPAQRRWLVHVAELKSSRFRFLELEIQVKYWLIFSWYFWEICELQMWTVNSLAVFKDVSIITVFFIVLCLKASCCGFTSAMAVCYGICRNGNVLMFVLNWSLFLLSLYADQPFLKKMIPRYERLWKKSLIPDSTLWQSYLWPTLWKRASKLLWQVFVSRTHPIALVNVSWR